MINFMKKAVTFAVLCALLVPVALVASEPPELQLEFVRKLRSNRMSDLALDYLLKLEKNPTPALKNLLPLEIARTRVSLARESPASKRLPVLEQARKGLEQYVARSKNKREIAQIKLEMARVTYYEAQALLNIAFRQEVKDAKEAFGTKAKKKFEDAKKEFQTAMKGIQGILGSLKKPKTDQEKLVKEHLARDLLQAKFDYAKIHIDEAGTYFDLSSGKRRLERSNLIEKAGKLLEKVARDYDEDRTNPEVSFLAVAWLMRTNQMTDNTNIANALYEKLLEYRTTLPQEAAQGFRWAIYFHILGMPKETHPPRPYEKMPKVKYVEKLCRDWLKAFPSYKTTAVGQGIRYELAKAHLAEALAISDKYSNPKAKPHYDKALEYFTKVADSDSDLAERARQKIFPIRIQIIGRNTKIADLKDFDDSVIKARYEMARLAEILGKASDAKTEKQRKELAKKKKEQFSTINKAFQRALELATIKTAPGKIDDVRYFMAYMYLLSGDPYRAAIMGEYLARRNPPSQRSPLAASYALQALKSIVDRHNVEANRDKLRELATYVVQKRGREWANQPVMGMAQYQLAMVNLREKKYDATLALLKNLPKDFSAYTFAQAQLALTALNAQKNAEEKRDAKKAAAYRDQALAALNRIPTLPKDPDPATSQMFFVAQLEHGKLMYADAAAIRKQGKDKIALQKYREMAKFTKSMREQFARVKSNLDAEGRELIGNALDALSMYARLGLGEMEYRAGAFDKVLGKDLTGETVSFIEKRGKTKGPIAMKDYQVAGELLGLAMRAQVQKGNIKKAESLLNLLQRLQGQRGEITDPTLPLQKLIADLSQQVKELEQKKDKKKLKDVTGKFTKFFDALLASKGSKSLDRNTVFFLGRMYQILDQYQKAADLYKNVPRPPAFDPKTPLAAREQVEKKLRTAQAHAFFSQETGKDPDDPKTKLSVQEKAKLDMLTKKAQDDFEKWRRAEYQKKDQLWWLMQVYRGKALRKAAEQITDKDQRTKQLDAAEKVLDKVLNTKGAVGILLAQKEKNHLLEDRGFYGRAITKWSNFLQSRVLRQQIRQDPRLKEMYFDAYYHFVWCWYQYSQHDGKKYEEKYLKRAADYVLRLENAQNKEGWQLVEARVQGLFKEAPALKRVYDQMKQEMKTAGK